MPIKKPLVIFSIAFFSTCIALIAHLIFSPSNYDIRRSIFIYIVIYGGLNSVYEIFKNRNTAGYGISRSRAVGWLLGFTAGLYFGSQASIYFSLGSIESSSVAVGISFGCGEAGGQAGSFLGNKIFSV